jgi:hypothetical protein
MNDGSVTHQDITDVIQIEREKGGIDKLMGITNAVRVPTQYVKEKKNCRLFFLFRVYVFIFIFLAFNLEKKVIFIHIHIVCVCCNHVLERWIPGVIFFFPLRTQVDVVVYDHVGSDLCLSNCSSLIPTPYISFSKNKGNLRPFVVCISSVVLRGSLLT